MSSQGDVEQGEKGEIVSDVVAQEKVDWDGPDDPENPMNWSNRKKMQQLVLMAANTFITYVFHHFLTVNDRS
jgi:hypothetical protein